MRMNARISSALLDAILRDARLTPNVERCGLLLGQGSKIEQHVPCANVNAEPQRGFEIDPAVLIAAHVTARQGGPQILGYYHNHPNDLDAPSTTDAEYAQQTDMLWMIITAHSYSLWRSTSGGTYLGRFSPVSLAVLP